MILKILAWVFGTTVVLVLVYFVVLFVGLIFSTQITELMLKVSSEFVPLLDGITVKEVSKNEKPLAEKFTLSSTEKGDLPVAKEMILEQDGSIVERQRVFDSDTGQEVKVLSGKSKQPSLVFIKNKVYVIADKKLGELIGEYSEPELSYIGYVSYINDNYLLVVGSLADPRKFDTYLWQVERSTLHKLQIAKDIYYTFDRPPMTFTPKGFDGVVVVYYVGSYSYAMGGDSSRPKFSVIRIYNSDFPDGKDIAKFGFKAGTIVDVRWENDSLVLTGDPSRPAMADIPRKPARIWHLQYRAISN